MAKRKKSTKKTYRRRATRRVSGVGAVDVTGIALSIAGAVGAKIISTKLASGTGSLAKMAPYAPLIIGIVLPMVVKNNPMVNQIAVGLVAGGGVAALGQNGLKIISGMEDSIAGYVGYPTAPQRLPYKRVAGVIAGAPGEQGLPSGTRSNFSGSRLSQINTIAGIDGGNFDGSGSSN